MAGKNVKDVMTKNPECVTEKETLRAVAKMMADNDCGAIPVVDSTSTRKPVGMITDRDIVIRAIAKGKDPATTTVADAMSKGVKTVKDDDSIDKVFKVMSDAKVRRVPVVDSKGGVVGIVAVADVAETNQDRKLADAVEEISERGKGSK
ncbi:MAG TPA: CBS domain-containing protein [Thermoanaerobaculia bacterium]|nr:CBS domain-containing protein [Thermoanaerobaculia bacterium]